LRLREASSCLTDEARPAWRRRTKDTYIGSQIELPEATGTRI
jgi:hypothetical protein